MKDFPKVKWGFCFHAHPTTGDISRSLFVACFEEYYRRGTRVPTYRVSYNQWKMRKDKHSFSKNMYDSLQTVMTTYLDISTLELSTEYRLRCWEHYNEELRRLRIQEIVLQGEKKFAYEEFAKVVKSSVRASAQAQKRTLQRTL